MADLTITPANVLFIDGSKITGVAGAAITAGQSLYNDGTTSTLKLAQCDGTAAEAAVLGIALHAAGIGQPMTYAAHGSRINIGGTTVKTTTYMVAATAGGVAPQADLISTQRIVRIGYATDAAGAFTVDIKNTGAVV